MCHPKTSAALALVHGQAIKGGVRAGELRPCTDGFSVASGEDRRHGGHRISEAFDTPPERFLYILTSYNGCLLPTGGEYGTESPVEVLLTLAVEVQAAD